ncbi:hypothetical protein [Streptomyces sp. NPDC058086]|uniref:hypothetical protein n=1 Tax=Streptomyces sp. NPDC058086 TaxID=3346334 RepID=UPI0036E8786B
MAENQDDIANLKPLYAARLAEDLERNAREQERLSSEMAALQARLETLRHNQVLLVNMQQALGQTVTADETPSSADSNASVPRQGRPAPQAGQPRPDHVTQSAVPQKTAPAAPSASADKSGRNTPTLRDLAVGYLSQEGAPRSALAVTDALTEAHQDRGFKITVVRSTLEAMVARGQVRRSKQGKSVFYTATATLAADKKRPVTA